jgi:hypothetical protein
MAVVELEADGFRGMAAGDLRAEEIASFYYQLNQLQESLSGTAEFETMEGWLNIRIEGNRRGQMTCQCVLRDQGRSRSQLECTIDCDQTFSRLTLTDLKKAMHEFPVIGQP